MGSFGVNVGRHIKTIGDFEALSAVRGGDASLPKLLCDFLLLKKFSGDCV